ncbi:hypothetical protein FVEN_g13101 [Fusarium venenatum]|nr:hypothetical protein FVEN_g13101 [Fusarium venenatum]
MLNGGGDGPTPLLRVVGANQDKVNGENRDIEK